MPLGTIHETAEYKLPQKKFPIIFYFLTQEWVKLMQPNLCSSAFLYAAAPVVCAHHVSTFGQEAFNYSQRYSLFSAKARFGGRRCQTTRDGGMGQVLWCKIGASSSPQPSLDSGGHFHFLGGKLLHRRDFALACGIFGMAADERARNMSW